MSGIRFFLSLISSQVTKDFQVIIPDRFGIRLFYFDISDDSSDRAVNV